MIYRINPEEQWLTFGSASNVWFKKQPLTWNLGYIQFYVSFPHSHNAIYLFLEEEVRKQRGKCFKKSPRHLKAEKEISETAMYTLRWLILLLYECASYLYCKSLMPGNRYSHRIYSKINILPTCGILWGHIKWASYEALLLESCHSS